MSEERAFSKELGRAEDERLSRSLDLALSDRMLSHADAGSELTRSLDLGINLMLPTTSEIDHALEVDAISIPNDREIADVILNGGYKEITLEGMSLNSLLERGGGSLAERSLLKRGMLFVAHQKYVEAAEWWTLNRPAEVRSDARLYTLLTLLLALTHQLAGQTQLAAVAIAEAKRALTLYELGGKA